MENDGEEGDMTDYEKQRLARIMENKARLEALGLRGLASSVRNELPKQAQGKGASSAPKKTKKADADDEEEYQPSEEDEEEEEEEPGESSHSSEEERPSSSSRRKASSC